MSPLAALLMLGAGQATATAPAPTTRKINFWVGRNVAPGKNIRLVINTQNVPEVKAEAFPVDGFAWLSREHDTDERPKPTGRAVKSWNITVRDPKQPPQPTNSYYSRQTNVPIQVPGVYLVKLSGYGEEETQVVNVTNLAVFNKRSPKQDLAWVTDFRTGNTVPSAGLSFFTKEGSAVKSATTGSDGARLLALDPRADILVVRRGRDLASVAVPSPDYDGVLSVFWQTDRPIYRPGQTISFKAILRRSRGQGYSVGSGRTVPVVLKDANDTPLDQKMMKTNANGSLAGDFTIPSEGMLGAYTIELKDGEDISRKEITVAEYRKPEFKVDTLPEQPRYLSGEKLHFKIHAGYYFGAPLPQAAIRWVARRSGLAFGFPDQQERWFGGGDGNLYPRDTYAASPFAAEGQTVTDNDGNAEIEIASDADAPDSTYTIDGTVTDATHREVKIGASVPVYASNYRISIESEVQAVALGGLVPVDLRLCDLDRHPVSATVSLRVFHYVFDKKAGKDVEETLSRTTYKVPAGGSGRVNLPALAADSVIFEATVHDQTGRIARDRCEIWVEDPSYKPPKEKPEPSMDIKLDKRVYEPGSTVKAFISDNNPNRPVLVVAEGLEIWEYHVFRGKAEVYKFKTDRKMSPNAYITASQWVASRQVTAEQRVPLPDMSRLLKIEVQPDKREYRPGDQAVYTVTAHDRQGRPVATEVSLSVVDEAIYALAVDTTGDPYEEFWGLRPNHVATDSSSPEEVSGGAYQRAAPASPTVRQRFEDTAYWNAFVETGPDGTGKVTFEMPGNLTTWHAKAIAMSPETSVGSAEGTIVATRPLTLRLALPRQLASGDSIQVKGTINNRTGSEAHVGVHLTASGADVNGPADSQVNVPANGQTVVTWNVRCPRVPAGGKATFQAEADGGSADMSDALKMSVPVSPPGYPYQTTVGGSIGGSGSFTIELPADALGEAIQVRARVYKGVSSKMMGEAQRLTQTPLYGSPAAANSLIAAAGLGLKADSEVVREDLAMLSRTHVGAGWGWWEGSPADPVITAQVAHALAVAPASGIDVYPILVTWATGECQALYSQTQLWEHRALLAAAMVELGAPNGDSSMQEVRDHGLNLSPFARLRMAEALTAPNSAEAMEELKEVLPLVSRGPSASYLPVGDGIGWTASPIQTTAELLTTLIGLKTEPELQTQLVAWLLDPSLDWQSSDDDRASLLTALRLYCKEHPDSGHVGDVTLDVAGQTLKLTPSTVDESASGELTSIALRPGKNQVRIERKGDGDALVQIDALCYRPGDYESHTGLRVARRFEVRNAAGVWTEVNRSITPGEPVRVTLSVWGDDIPDAVKVDEPIPAGFEFVDSEIPGYDREEVRDRAMIHFLANAGTPTVIRYYLRSEAGGRVRALPASGQYLRRPAASGHGVTDLLIVEDKAR